MAVAGETQTAGLRSDDRPYLLVLDEAGSHRVPLPRAGALTIGRAEDCEIQLADGLASRRHARIEVDGQEVTIVDLDSHNGTRVNDRPIGGPRRLASSDLIGVGGSVLVLHVPAGRTGGDLVEGEQARRRLEREVARARRHGRPLAVALVDLGGGDRAGATALCREALGPEHLIGALDDGTLLLVLPETEAEQARRLAAGLRDSLALAAPDATIATATFPADGADDGALLSSARAALRGDVDSIEVGDRRVITADPAMVQTYALLRRLARSEMSVLITGETGAGKEMAAYALHVWSPRAAGRFVAVNCAALPETLAESELFGYERGAFSGAARSKPGLVEQAAGGTLFLDEIGELPPVIQAKLLRTLEERSLLPLGATEPVAVDFRLVAATNRDVAAEVAAGRFRSDLYYRVAAAAVAVPPLRDRPRDIPVLARAFLARACAQLGRAPAALSDGALRTLGEHRFAGNVRELVNAMDYAAATAAEEVIEPWHLPPTVGAPAGGGGPAEPAPFRSLADEIEALERRRIGEALAATGGNQTRAADLIGMPRRTFVGKVARYGLRASDE